VLAFETENQTWKKLIKENRIPTLVIEAPRFWEINKLLDFVGSYLRLPLSFESKNWILDSIENDLSSFYNTCTVLKLNYPESREIKIDEVKSLFTLDRLDQFSMASSFARKKFDVFFDRLTQLEGDFEKMRQFFNFMQSHLIKMADTSYLSKKPRLTQYDKDLQGYQEYLIFSLLLFCSKILFLLNVNKKISNNFFYYLILIMTVILLPWIKNEGIFYSIFISIIFFLFNFIYLKKKIIFIIIIFINIVTQIFFIKFHFQSDQIFQVPLIQETIFKNFFKFEEFLSRLLIISYYIFHGLVKYPLILINLISILIIYIYRKHLAVPNFFIIFFFLNLIFLYSIYMVTTHPLIWHLQTSIKRLMLQTSGFYIILLSVIANKNSFKLI
jgi:hypothetical protein